MLTLKGFCGRLNSCERERLCGLIKEAVLKGENFRLSSGRSSNYYIDGKSVTLNPEGAYLAAKLILEIVMEQ
jgi:orotate phosphoribosyltransferase